MNELTQTYRPTVPALEEKIGIPHPVLDHGFVRLIDYMGADSAIVQAARVSYGTGTKTVREDRGLIRYLIRHRHTTPLEMCEIKFHFKMPIFVARQWLRHRTASINEYSARYSVLDKEFYIPEPENLQAQSNTNRQGRYGVLHGQEADEVLRILRADAAQTYASYEYMMQAAEDGDKQGLSRELARMNLPVNIYTQMYWKVNLHNLLHFLALRMDTHAQYEIRQFANTIAEIVKAWVPDAWEAFEDYRLHAYTLSRMERAALEDALQGRPLREPEDYGMSKREWREFILAVGVKHG